MIRVGLIANTFDSTFGAAAGGHVHFLEVARRWRDVELTVFAPRIAQSMITKELPNARFIAMPSLDATVGNAQINTLYRSLFAPLKIFELRSCDVLIATSHFLPNLVPALLARHGRFIVTIQHILDPPRKRSGSRLANIISYVFQSVALALVRNFAPLVLVNRPDQADSVGINPLKTRVYIMTHGVDHAASSLRTFERSEDVLYLGRLVPTKGIDELLQAWQLVLKVCPDARLTIAGGGEAGYARQLNNIAVSLGIESTVRFLGRVSDAHRFELLRTHRIFVFPSKEEGWGIGIAEAMAAGLPCVTYDLEAYRSVFVQGRVSVPVSDVLSFSRRIVELLTNEVARKALSAEALALGQTFSWDEAATIERDAIADVSRRAL